MDEKKTTVDVQFSDPVKSTSHRRRLVLGAVIGLLSTLVIAVVALAYLYLELKTSKHSYKEAWMTFRNPSDDTLIKERVTLYGSELKVIRPGLLKLVVDYEQNQLVVQYDQELHGAEHIVCYVYKFDPGMFGSPEKSEEYITPGVVEAKYVIRLTFETTAEKFPQDLLSPRSRDMCFGATHLKMIQTEAKEHDRVRRRPLVEEESEEGHAILSVGYGDGDWGSIILPGYEKKVK